MNDDNDRHLTPDVQAVIADELRRLGYTVTAPPTVERDPAGGLPTWLVDREDDDGTEGFTMLGRGLDDV